MPLIGPNTSMKNQGGHDLPANLTLNTSKDWTNKSAAKLLSLPSRELGE